MSLDYAKHRLIVEGPDDQHVTVHLIQRERPALKGEWPRFIQSPAAEQGDDGNVGAAIKRFAGLVETAQYERIGLLVDADENVANRWKQITDALAPFIKLPPSPDTGGTLVDEPTRRIGIWLWPDNQSPGALEDFLWPLVPTDQLANYAVEAATTARTKGAPFTDAKALKAQFRTWLAWQKQPGLPPGDSIKRSIVPGKTPTVDAFTAWFERLFLEPL